MILQKKMKSSIGDLYLAEEGNSLIWVGTTPFPGETVEGEVSKILAQTQLELTEYLQGVRKEFTICCRAEGTDFQRKIWDALCAIPYGETRSYGQIAAATGNAKASRAVGMANNRNPIMIIIPCHRVIGSNGSLTGYGGGLDVKEKLLALEAGNKGEIK